MIRKRKAIFGGTFDPLHNGHLYIANEAFKLLELDKLIFVPSGNPPHKTEKIITDASIRYELVKKTLENYRIFEVNSYEVERKEISYTYKTLQYFNKLEEDTDWFFVVGADCLQELHLWKNVNEILEICKFVVFSRPGYKEVYQRKIEAEKKYGKEIILLSIDALNISSSMIREKVKNNENISDLVPESVDKAIKELKLYKEEYFHVE